MTTIPLVIGIAWIIHGALIYWAYGLPQDFARDGTPKAYVPGDRPHSIRDIARILRRFARGATALVAGGILLVIVGLVGGRP